VVVASQNHGLRGVYNWKKVIEQTHEGEIDISCVGRSALGRIGSFMQNE